MPQIHTQEMALKLTHVDKTQVSILETLATLTKTSFADLETNDLNHQGTELDEDAPTHGTKSKKKKKNDDIFKDSSTIYIYDSTEEGCTPRKCGGLQTSFNRASVARVNETVVKQNESEAAAAKKLRFTPTRSAITNPKAGTMKKKGKIHQHLKQQ